MTKSTNNRSKKFYIGERYNPQLTKPYYKSYGKLSKAEAKRKENCAYGNMYLTAYDTQEEYEAAKQELIEKGFRVSNI